MANLGLGLTGAYVGGALTGGNPIGIAIGYAIGASLGGVIDAKYVYPAVFGKPDQGLDGPKSEDIRTQLANEGAPIHIIYGNEVLVAGNLIWMGDVRRELIEFPGGYSYEYYCHAAIHLCANHIQSINKIWADGRLIWTSTDGVVSQDPAISGILWNNHRGSLDQDPDPIMEAAIGVGKVSAYRGHAYVVFTDIALHKFGNRLPTFTFLVSESDSRTVKSTIEDLLIRAGLTADQMDLTALPDDLLKGYVVSGIHSTIKTIEPLLLYKDWKCQEKDGKMVFFEAEKRVPLLIEELDLGASIEGTASEGSEEPFNINRSGPLLLPDEVNVTYTDPQLTHAFGSQRDRRRVSIGKFPMDLRIPVVMRAAEARSIARRLLWRAWVEKEEVTFALPPRYAGIREEDLLQIPYRGNTYSVRIKTIDQGANFVLNVTGVIEDSVDNGKDVAADSGNDLIQYVYEAAAIYPQAADLAPIRATDYYTWGIYAGFCFQDQTKEFRGGSVWVSHDGTNFSQADVLDRQASIGKAISVLQIGPTTIWDNAAFVDVEMYSGIPTTASDDDVLNGANRMLIGNEIIAYRNVTQIGTNKYRLSRLIRGVRNTEYYAARQHYVDDRVVMLDAGFKFIPVARFNLDRSIWVKLIPDGGLLIDATPITFIFKAMTIRPFSPTGVQMYRNTNSDRVISWQRRSRAITRLFTQSSDLLGDQDVYDLEFYSLPGGTLLRTQNGVIGRTFTYTAAMSAEDGIGLLDNIDLRIYQVSTAVGRGNVYRVAI